jgi:hypothetical protein
MGAYTDPGMGNLTIICAVAQGNFAISLENPLDLR